METINVLGGKGYVGSHFVENSRFSVIANDKFDYVPCCNDVLNFISTNHNYNVFANPFLDINTNLIVLVEILENWRARNPNGIFNFVSSWFVYGDNGSPQSKETDACNPKGFYSITKRAAEQLLISYCETYNLNYRILRLANVAGTYDPGASAKKNALQHLINLMKEGSTVELYEDGEFHRDYIHIDDVVRAIDLVLDRGEINQIYNIGNGTPIHFGELIRKAHTMIGSSSEIKSIEQKEFHKKVQVKSFFMNNQKLTDLGYKPTKTVENILEGMI